MKKYDNAARARTCLAKYGFEHPMQDPDIRRRSQRRYAYCGVRFDSSYELALYIWLVDNGLDFEYQPSVSFEYFDGNGKRHFYQPDFRIEGFLYEVKGRQFIANDGSWKNPYNQMDNHVYEAKRKCCLAYGVKVITECDEFVGYVEKRYGSDFIGANRSSPVTASPSKADLNPYFRNRKLDLPDIGHNVYRIRCPKKFDELRSLVEAYPKTYQRKLDAVGRKREMSAGTAPELPFRHLKTWIDGQLPLLDSPQYKTPTKVAWILLGFIDFPKCVACGKQDNYIGQNIGVTRPYGPYCCRDCAFHSQLKNKHAGDTKERRYGSRTYVNVTKMKETCDRKKAENPDYYKDIIDKRRETCIDLYGVDNPMKCEVGLNALVESNMRRYGVPFYTCLDEMHASASETYMKSYGKDWYVQTKEFKELAKSTMRRNFGVDYAGQSAELMQKAKQKYFYDSMYFSSAPEVAFYIWHIDSGIDIEYQPKCDLWYEYDGISHRYHPDFDVGGVLYELKGDQFLNDDGTWRNPYDRSQDGVYEAKRQCCIRNGVRILHKSDYGQYVEYVERRYGRHYIRGFKTTQALSVVNNGMLATVPETT